MSDGREGGGPPAERPIARVMEKFGYDGASIETIKPIAQRLRNENYRVRADDQDWVVKRYRPEQVTRRLERAHVLEARLLGAGFPAATILSTDSGQTLVQEGAHHYSVHAWVEGVKVSVADRELVLSHQPSFMESMGAHLGALHRISATIDRTGELELARSLEQPSRTLARVRRARLPRPSRWQRLRWKPKKTAFDRWIIEVMPEVARQAELLSRHAVTGGVEPADVIVIHNDINWENLIFDEEFHLRALIDFDNADVGLRPFEIGSAAVVLGGADPERRRAFLTSYAEVAGVPVDEGLVDLGMVARCVRSLAWSISVYLNGAVQDTELLASWCAHTYESLQRLTRA